MSRIARAFRNRSGSLLRALYLLVLFGFLYLPIGLLILNSFNASKYGFKWQGFTWKWYERLWNNESLREAFFNSLLLGVSAATLTTILGALAALALYRYRFPGKNLTRAMLFTLLLSPDIVLAITFLLMFVSIGLPLGYFSLLLAHTTFCLPFVVVTVSAQLNSFDSHLIEAAQDLGANDRRVATEVILPILRPSLLAGWLLVFTLSLDDVIISSFVSGPGFEILPIRVFSMVKVGVSPEVNVLATLLLAVSFIAALLVLLLNIRRQS